MFFKNMAFISFLSSFNRSKFCYRCRPKLVAYKLNGPERQVSSIYNSFFRSFCQIKNTTYESCSTVKEQTQCCMLKYEQQFNFPRSGAGI